jgi:hypothetical protein
MCERAQEPTIGEKHRLKKIGIRAGPGNQGTRKKKKALRAQRSTSSVFPFDMGSIAPRYTSVPFYSHLWLDGKDKVAKLLLEENRRKVSHVALGQQEVTVAVPLKRRDRHPLPPLPNPLERRHEVLVAAQQHRDIVSLRDSATQRAH